MFFRTNIIIITIFFTFSIIISRHVGDCRPDGLDENPPQDSGKSDSPRPIVNPIMMTKAEAKFANLDDEITFPCVVSNGDQLPLEIEQLNWSRKRKSDVEPLFFGGIPVKDDVRISHITLQGTSIVIKPVKSTDTAQYVCEVADSKYTNISVQHHLAVNAPPAIKILPSNGRVHVVRDKEIRLECITDAADLKWTKEGGKIDDNLVIYEKNALIIKKASRSDSGKYNCTAYNEFAKHSTQQFVVTVEDKPSVEIPRKVIHSGIGRAEEIVCLVQSTPQANVIWYREDNKNSLKMKKVSSEYILPLSIESVNDFGIYTCKAENKYGSAEGSVEINGRPAKPQILNDDTQYLTSDAFNLRFRVISYSPVKEVKMFTRSSENNGESFTEWNETSITIPEDPTHERNVDIPLHNLQRIIHETKVVAINEYGASEPSDVYSISAGGLTSQMATASSTRLTGVSAFFWLSLSLLAMYIGRIR
ncbi:lachesin-like [Brevipalpus obovatus]|uniref:lachesin-like n=1 Tax=Brevipalpus obovatus TaxID=246614 RepID=UPI003D9F36FD